MRRAALVAGLFVLGTIWLGPLLGAYRESFAAHMLAHMGVVAIAAPLVALGIAGTRLDFSRAHPLLLAVPASLLELAVVWFWHVPDLRATAQASSVAAVAEQVSFLAVGLLLWTACFGRNAPTDPARDAAGAFGLLLTTIHMTLLGALLALAPRPLYGAGEVTCFGVSLTAGQDQQLGGVLMLMIGAAVYLAGGLVLVARLLRDDDVARRQAEAAP